jgi:hypothetical protein
MQNVQKSVNNGQQLNVGRQRRKLRNENLELILKSSEALMEDFIELDVKVINLVTAGENQLKYMIVFPVKR